MGFFVTSDNHYYEGDRRSETDIQCDQRPSCYHKYDKTNKKWVKDKQAILELKKHVSNTITNGYEAFVRICDPNHQELAKVEALYKDSMSTLLKTEDPNVLISLAKVVDKFEK